MRPPFQPLSSTRRDSNMGGKNLSLGLTNVRQMPLLLNIFAHNT
jgi:hypothetical protein